MKPNPGYLPAEAEGKRVFVLLTNGRRGKSEDNPMSPPGWAADGKGGCCWRRTGGPFDIDQYEVIA